MLIDLPKEKIKFCIVGSGKSCCVFSKMLIDNGFPHPIVITWNRKIHKRDQILLEDSKEYEDIFSFCNSNSIEIIESNNINDVETIKLLKRQNVNIIFSIASRWIMKKHFIDDFKGLVVNLHQGNLPLERGSVIYQRIMNDIDTIGVSLHKISVGIDAGNILYKKTKKIKNKSHNISNVNSINMALSIQIFNDFINDLIDRIDIKEHVQDSDSSIYMPQFYTEINGAIDWGWKAHEIDNFVRAFGPPMPGAFSFLNGEKIIILESHIEKTKQKYHPYFYGRIVTIKNDSSIRVITKKHYVIIEKIKYGDFLGKPGKVLKLNSKSVLNTPLEVLEKAKTHFISSLKMKPPK